MEPESAEIRLDATSTAIPIKRMEFSGRNPCAAKRMGNQDDGNH
jgi:hypothetical protein